MMGLKRQVAGPSFDLKAQGELALPPKLELHAIVAIRREVFAEEAQGAGWVACQRDRPRRPQVRTKAVPFPQEGP